MNTIHPFYSPARLATCIRCGVTRTAGGNTSVVCRDCRDVMTVQERKAWAA